MPGGQAAVFLAAVERVAVAHAFALGNMHPALGAGQHGFDLVGRAPARVTRGARAGTAAQVAQRAAHPPDGDENKDEEQQIAHDGQGDGELSPRSLPREPIHTRCRRSQAVASVASFLAKQKRMTRSSRPSAKNADTGIAATPISRARRSTKALSASSEMAR